MYRLRDGEESALSVRAHLITSFLPENAESHVEWVRRKMKAKLIDKDVERVDPNTRSVFERISFFLGHHLVPNTK